MRVPYAQISLGTDKRFAKLCPQMPRLVVPQELSVKVERSLAVRAFRDLARSWYLIGQFLRRDISIRYRGTFFGLFWSFLSPLLMLAVYLFVFGFIFNARFGIAKNESTFDYGLALFCGLNFFNLFSEVVLRSPTLVLQYPNLVKKVVFPLEIFPIVATGTAIFHCLIAFLPLAIGLGISRHEIPFTVLYLFVFLVPLSLLTCGASWIFAAIGVFFRDIQPILVAAITILMFMSAIFFPLRAVPEKWRAVIGLNPMVHLVESARAAIVWGVTPNWLTYFVLFAGSLAIFLMGYFVFDRSKSAFADVL
jgi:lipopolysaccharide transport system permease protein